MGIFIVTGFILGLTSNFHCIGMCGPIAMAIPVNRESNFTILLGALQYNLGRIFTYAILGLLIGSVGLTVNTFGILQWLSIISGIGLIIFAWRKYIQKSFSSKIPSLGIQSTLNKSLGKVIRSNSPFKLLLLGGLNGLLPCGMVFTALLNAVLTGEIIYSGLAMVAFGVGTLPAMIAVVFMTNKISQSARQKMNNLVPYLLTIVGVLIILRGLNLGIPYISPTIKAVQQTENSSVNNTEVEMSCCHAETSCD